MSNQEAHEARLRRLAKSHGLSLHKQRARHSQVPECCWYIKDPDLNAIVAPSGYDGHIGMSVEEVEDYFEE